MPFEGAAVSDARWATRALALAVRAEHRNSPNPMVGCVILDRHGQLAGEGYNERDGGPHAEMVALAQAGERARGGTLYVSLEPCSHQGRTPPCAEAVVEAGLSRVVVSMEDPDPRVSGRGIATLRAAGIDVEVGLLGTEAERVLAFYLKHRRTGRPYVTAKWAMSLDGKIATSTADSRWITGAEAREDVHRLRHQHDAILVGVNTVIEDDPQLTARPQTIADPRQPLRVIVDSRLRVPATARIFDPSLGGQTLIATTERARPADVQRLQEAGAEVALLPAGEGAASRVDLAALADHLGARRILSVLAEGGSEVHGELVRAGLVDSVVAYLGSIVIGGRDAPGPVGGAGFSKIAQALRLEAVEWTTLGSDFKISGDVHRDR